MNNHISKSIFPDDWEVVDRSLTPSSWMLEPDGNITQTTANSSRSNGKGSLLVHKTPLENLTNKITLEVKNGTTYIVGLVFNYSDIDNFCLFQFNQKTLSYTGYDVMVAEVRRGKFYWENYEKYKARPSQNSILAVRQTDTGIVFNLNGEDFYTWNGRNIDPLGRIGLFSQKNTDARYISLFSETQTIVKTGLLDTTKIQQAVDILNQFTSLPKPDSVAPRVLATSPREGSTFLDSTTPRITATFSEPIDPATLNSETFFLNGGASGSVTYDNVSQTATLVPLKPLDEGSRNEGVLTTGIRDTSGNALESEFRFRFSAGRSLQSVPLHSEGQEILLENVHTFGNYIDIDGNTAIISSMLPPDATGKYKGLANIYIRNSTTGDWEAQGILSPSGAGSYSRVAISGDTLALASSYGVVFLYERNGASWELIKTIDHSKGTETNLWPLVLSGNVMAFGLRIPNQYSKVYIYERNPDGIWNSSALLTSPDGRWAGHFGKRISIYGNNMAISSYFQSKMVYIYTKTLSSGWHFDQTIKPFGNEGYTIYGYSMAMNEKYLAVTARGPEAWKHTAVVCMYRLSNGTWTEHSILQPSPPDSPCFFGASLSMNSNTLLVSAHGNYIWKATKPVGSAFLFRLTPENNWILKKKLVHPEPEKGWQFGNPLVITEDSALTSAYTQRGTKSVRISYFFDL